MIRVLLISGSTRAASANTALVRTAPLCTPPGVVTFRHGLTALPHFNPDDDHDPLPPSVGALRAGIAAADAILFCTPEYAGTLPGSLKNLLDWTVGGDEMPGRPVAWVNVATDPRRGHGASETLRTVLGYVQADVIDDACVNIPVPSSVVDADGVIADDGIRAAITEVLSVLVREAGHPGPG